MLTHVHPFPGLPPIKEYPNQGVSSKKILETINNAENNILNQSESFWKEHKKKVDEFKIQLQNKKVFDEMYQIFVGCGYGRSKEDFKRLIFEPNKEGLDKQKFEYLEMKINKADPQYQAKARNIIIAILLLIYPLRYLGILLKWSLKQIQKNRFEN